MTTPTNYSVNERAERVMGRRLTPEQEKTGVVPFDFPCELGYWCPTCKKEWDEGLQWSEYKSFLWCERCDFDWPSALCVRVDAVPDPEREWMKLGRDAAVAVFLDSVRDRIAVVVHEARVAAIEECAAIADTYGWAAAHATGDSATIIRKGRDSEDDADEIAAEIRAKLAPPTTEPTP